MGQRRGFGHVFRKYEGSSTWYVRFPDPSKPKTAGGRASYTVRAVGSSRKQAERLLTAIHRAIVTGTYAAPEEDCLDTTITVSQAVRHYIQSKIAEGRSERGIQRYESSRRAIEASPISSRLVSQLHPRNVESYMAWRRKHRWGTSRRRGAARGERPLVHVKPGERVSNSSVNRDLALLSAAIQRLVRMGQLAENPARLVRRGTEPKRGRVVLSKEETVRIIRAADPHFRILALAAAYTGARPRSELQPLTWGAVNLSRGTITITRSKVGNASTFRLHPLLVRELWSLKERRAAEGTRIVTESEHIFLSKRGRADWDYRYAWRKALKQAGLDRRKGLTFYSFRHGFATHFLEQGGAPSDLQEILGHASMTTTDHYVRMVSARAAASMEALDYGLDEANVRTYCVPVPDSGAEVHGDDAGARTA